jgi:hypothetical protein
MRTRTCTNCQGRGVETDYNTRIESTKNSFTYGDRPCIVCSGAGVIYDYSPDREVAKKSVAKAAPVKPNSTKTSSAKKTSGNDFSMNDFFMLLGFIIGGIAAYQYTSNWIAIGVTALISGFILRITYKLIFVILIILAVVYFYNQ